MAIPLGAFRVDARNVTAKVAVVWLMTFQIDRPLAVGTTYLALITSKSTDRLNNKFPPIRFIIGCKPPGRFLGSMTVGRFAHNSNCVFTFYLPFFDPRHQGCFGDTTRQCLRKSVLRPFVQILCLRNLCVRGIRATNRHMQMHVFERVIPSIFRNLCQGPLRPRGSSIFGPPGGSRSANLQRRATVTCDQQISRANVTVHK
jgi:hypothetical protein